MIAQRLSALVVVASVVALAVASTAAARGGSGVVSRNGKVGQVQVGTSTPQQVLRFAGRPTRDAFETVESGAVMQFYTYNCGSGRSTTYVFDADGRLANFVTTCRRWRTANGTRIRDSQETAEHNEGKAATPAQCGDGETIERVGKASLFLTFFAEGGAVRSIAVAGRNGVLGC